MLKWDEFVKISFAFLKSSPALAKLGPAADKLVKLYDLEFYRDVISNSRLLLETLAKKIIKLAGLNEYYPLPSGEYYNLRNDTEYLRQTGRFPLSIMNLFDEVRRLGNAAIHDAKYQPTKEQAWHCLVAVHDLLVYALNAFDNKKLYYLRPDLLLESQLHPEHFKSQKRH